jgi:hypothetical protein
MDVHTNVRLLILEAHCTRWQRLMRTQNPTTAVSKKGLTSRYSLQHFCKHFGGSGGDKVSKKGLWLVGTLYSTSVNTLAVQAGIRWVRKDWLVVGTLYSTSVNTLAVQAGIRWWFRQQERNDNVLVRQMMLKHDHCRTMIFRGTQQATFLRRMRQDNGWLYSLKKANFSSRYSQGTPPIPIVLIHT